MNELYQGLLQLQELDFEMMRAEARVREFDPQLEELDAPIHGLERELEALGARLLEMRADVRRLERAAEEKRERLRRYQERLDRVRNMREEAAAHREPDRRQRAAEADEKEAREVMDQSTRQALTAHE